MTVVAIWYEEGWLWSAADTRISAPGDGGGHIVRTDNGAKLFSLPVSCRRVPSSPTEEEPPFFSTTYGFAFAGDILPALMTHATASTMLQDLMATDNNLPPSLSDIVNLVRNLTERFSRDILNSSNGTVGHFESAVFGYCPRQEQFEVYCLKTKIEDASFDVEVTKYTSEDCSEIPVALGTGSERVQQLTKRFREEGEPHRRKGRLPKHAVELMIEEDSGDIGGDLSSGIAGPLGFRLFLAIRPKKVGGAAAYWSFNGIRLDDEIGRVGPCIVGTPGMV